MTLRTTHPLRAALLGAVLAVAMAASLTGPSSADAAINASVENVTAGTSCNEATQTMTLGASMTFTMAHTNGAYVAHRFRYYQVNSAGYRISPFYVQNFNNPTFLRTWWSEPNIIGYPVLTNKPVQLNGPTISAAGVFRAEIEIAVWTGSSYRYTGWLAMNGYTNFYRWGFGMEQTYLSDCYTRWP